jgi:hypothetical protein
MANFTAVAQSIPSAGLVPSTQSVTSSDVYYFANTGREIAVITNGGSGTTLVAETPATVDGLAIADKTFTIAAGVTYLPVFNPSTYNQPSGTYSGMVKLTPAATVTIAILAVPRV